MTQMNFVVLLQRQFGRRKSSLFQVALWSKHLKKGIGNAAPCCCKCDGQTRYVRIRGKEEGNAGKGRLWGYFRTKNFIIHHR